MGAGSLAGGMVEIVGEDVRGRYCLWVRSRKIGITFASMVVGEEWFYKFRLAVVEVGEAVPRLSLRWSEGGGTMS